MPDSTDKPAAPKEVEITNQHRQDWNDYVLWLDKIGMRGNKELDTNDVSHKLLQKYIDLNPNTSLTPDIVVPIQKDFSKYRDWSLNEVKAGRRELGTGVTPENFLKDLSIVDGIPGHRTTTYMFPKKYMEEVANNKKQVLDQGFSTVLK